SSPCGNRLSKTRLTHGALSSQWNCRELGTAVTTVPLAGLIPTHTPSPRHVRQRLASGVLPQGQITQQEALKRQCWQQHRSWGGSTSIDASTVRAPSWPSA